MSRPDRQCRHKSPNGGLICSYNPNESVESSPAVGPFLAGGAEGIAVGTGDYFPGAPDSGVVLAVNSHCKLIWTTRLDGLTSSSPALANLTGQWATRCCRGHGQPARRRFRLRAERHQWFGHMAPEDQWRGNRRGSLGQFRGGRSGRDRRLDGRRLGARRPYRANVGHAGAGRRLAKLCSRHR